MICIILHNKKNGSNSLEQKWSIEYRLCREVILFWLKHYVIKDTTRRSLSGRTGEINMTYTECKHNLLPDTCFGVNLLDSSQIDNTTENNMFKCVCVCVYVWECECAYVHACVRACVCVYVCKRERYIERGRL